jgi:predicted kinase
MLYIFGGLPAAGKSTLSKKFAKVQKAVYLRIDTVEEAIEDMGSFVGPEGYEVAYRLAADNLKNGLSVIADSVNPIAITRDAWRKVAIEAGVSFCEIEIVCSNESEHRNRLEGRPARGPGKRVLKWDDVRNREYEPWEPHLVFDTAGKSLRENQRDFEELMREFQ